MKHFFAFAKRQVLRIAPDLKNYNKAAAGKDISAGITVGIVALPLSLALAIATGVPPVLGLYTAGIAGFMAAIFAGSPYSVSGPAAAMVPILAAVIQQHGAEKLPYITVIAAVFLLFFALVGVGKLIRKVPESVVLGFTAGIAVVIFFGQLNSFLGLHGLASHEHFAQKFAETITHLGTLSLPTLGVGVVSLAVILFIHRIKAVAKVPATLIAVTVAVLMVQFLPGFSNVATLGSQYGSLPLGLPGFNEANITPSAVLDQSLWVAGLKIAGLIAIESLLCAVVADKLTKTRHRSNQELAAQGVANLGSAFFGGIPATAVIARTGTIIKSGAHSRVASILHALVVLAFIVALAPVAANIPLTALSAVLLVTAIKISEYKEVAHFVRKKNLPLVVVLVATLVLTVFTDLVIGVGTGLLLHLAFETHGKLRGIRGKDGPLVLDEEEVM